MCAGFSANGEQDVCFVCENNGLRLTILVAVYAYVFTRLHQPPCDHTAQPILDLGKCSIPADKMVAHNQWDCQIC